MPAAGTGRANGRLFVAIRIDAPAMLMRPPLPLLVFAG
jgi:hypothetical protein